VQFAVGHRERVGVVGTDDGPLGLIQRIAVELVGARATRALLLLIDANRDRGGANLLGLGIGDAQRRLVGPWLLIGVRRVLLVGGGRAVAEVPLVFEARVGRAVGVGGFTVEAHLEGRGAAARIGARGDLRARRLDV